MKKTIVLCLVLALGVSTLAIAQSVTRFNPKVGITLSSLDENFDDFDFDVKKEHQVGWDAGIDFRIENGGFLIIPGIHYNGWTTEMTGVDDVSGVDLSDETTIHTIRVPLSVGYKFIGAGEKKGLGLYVRGGGNATYVAGFKEPDSDFADLDFTKDDINDFQFGVHGGVGVDISIINIEIMYEAGLSEFYENGSGEKHNQLVITAGLIF